MQNLSITIKSANVISFGLCKDFPKNCGKIFICNLINQDQKFHKEKFPSTEYTFWDVTTISEFLPITSRRGVPQWPLCICNIAYMTSSTHHSSALCLTPWSSIAQPNQDMDLYTSPTIDQVPQQVVRWPVNTKNKTELLNYWWQMLTKPSHVTNLLAFCK